MRSGQLQKPTVRHKVKYYVPLWLRNNGVFDILGKKNKQTN